MFIVSQLSPAEQARVSSHELSEMITEARSRSLAKAISYRVVSSIITGSILFGVTQRCWLSVGVALVDSIVKTSVFYLHERTWMMIGVNRSKRLQSEEHSQRAEAA